MSDFGNWIPQFFYDLIGRVAPGAALLFIGACITRRQDVLLDLPGGLFQEHTPTTLILALGLVASYLVGTILGGIGFFFEDWCGGKLKHWRLPRRIDQDAQPRAIDPRSFRYDSIRKEEPKIGERIAKLRAEAHMCRVLMVGSLFLGIYYLLFNRLGLVVHRLQSQYTVVVSLVMVGLGALALYFHLRMRTAESIRNACEMLGCCEPASKTLSS